MKRASRKILVCFLAVSQNVVKIAGWLPHLPPRKPPWLSSSPLFIISGQTRSNHLLLSQSQPFTSNSKLLPLPSHPSVHPQPSSSMSLPLFFFFFFFVSLSFPLSSLSANDTGLNAPCPLNFTVLNVVAGGDQPSLDSSTVCEFSRSSIRLVLSDYLRRTGFFLPPLNSSDTCWDNFQKFINQYRPNLDVRATCGFQTTWISQGCQNIITKEDFVSQIPSSAIQDADRNCNQSLENNSPCALCTTSLSAMQPSVKGNSTGNVSDCTAYPPIYAAAFANQAGPTDRGVAQCIFLLSFHPPGSSGNKRTVVTVVAVIVCLLALSLVIVGIWLHRRSKKKGRRGISITEMGVVVSGLDSMKESTTLIRFTFDDIKKATRNFSRDNIIGRGGYGNVYKGLLPDGTEVALKRFKNCSASGDASFTHEVEVIASVRHVNLVALIGYCTATTNLEGHQRIIVCDLVKNGSLHDHLFASSGKKLSWPVRQQIALGTARGLAYLHYGAQPSIIHRDIKASNILLDEKFEAKVADFGLAKFNPEGMTHMSTRVAGTMGYVAPEYALYGQLTERSDVFSYGVVLLELLSGKKALQMNEDGQPSSLSDLAWSLVRAGRAMDVIEDGMPESGSPEVLEKYVLIAVLCSHPQLYARPTMDQVVKMLETEQSVPSIPERPIPLVAGRLDIVRSAGSFGGSGQLSSPTGYRSFAYESECHSSNSKEEEGSSDSKILST